MRTFPCALSLLCSVLASPAAPVTDWQLIFDGDSDSSFTGGSGLTASPMIVDAHKSSIAANLPTVTLADGESLILTGTVSFSGALANGQFRFGLFDGDNPVTAGDGTGYVGFYAEAPSAGGSASITSNDGTNADHPFSTPGTIADLARMPDPGVTPAANTALDFSLTLTRSGEDVGVLASITDGGSYSSSAGCLGTALAPGSFTFDSAALLVGGTTSGEWNNVDATFSNVDVVSFVDGIPPDLVSRDPASGANGVSIRANLSATFNDLVVAGTGNITLKNLTAGTDVIIPVSDPQITVSGTTLTIALTTGLDAGARYAIQIDERAVADLAGNSYAGILPPDVTTWSFTTDATGHAFLSSKDCIVGEQEAGGAGLDYYPDSNSNMVGAGGVTGKRDDRNVVLGYTLPILPAGTTAGRVNFAFEITAARALNGSPPNLQVYLLDTTNPDASGTAFFFHGAGDSSASVELVDTTSVTIAGTSEMVFGDDTEDRVFTLTGDALALFRSFYGEDHIPDQAEAFFRFSLDEDPPLTSYRRYRIDLANDESGIDILPTGGNDFSAWIGDYPGVGARTGVDDDPDGDGNDNGVENFFGTDPSTFSQGLVAASVDSGAGTFTFTHPQNTTPADDLTAVYRWSTDPSAFHAAGTTAGGTTVDFSATTEAGVTTVTATVTGTPLENLFVDVQVTQN